MSKWDVVIVGAGPGGLSAGALLANAGKKVLVLEKGSVVGGRATSIEYEGHIVDNGTHGLSYDGFLESVFQTLGKEMPKLGTGVRTVYFENGKWRELAVQREELKQILKGIREMSLEEISAYDDVPLNIWASERNVTSGMHEWLEIMGMLWCPSDRYENVSAGDLLARLKEVMEKHKGLGSVGLVTAGLQTLTTPLAEAIQERGGEIRLNTRVSEVVIENGAAVGVLIEKGKQMFPAHVVETERIDASEVICTVPLWDLFKVIPEDVFPRWYRDWVKHIQHKVAYVGGIAAGLNKMIFEDENKWYWVPKAPRTSKVTSLTCFVPSSQYVKVPGQYQVRFDFQTTYETMNLFELDQAKNRRDLRVFFDDLEEDIREIFPGWEEHCLWKIRYVAPIDIAMSAGLVGRHRPDRNPPGIKNLYLVSDTLRHEKGNWTQASAYESLVCVEQILKKR